MKARNMVTANNALIFLNIKVFGKTLTENRKPETENRLYDIPFDSPLIIFLVRSRVARNGFKSSWVKYSISFAIISWVSNSAMEPKLIARNCLNSLAEFLPWPSAMLEGIDTAALLI